MTERYEHEELEDRLGFGMELRGRPVDLAVGAGFISLGLAEIAEAATHFSFYPEGNKLTPDQWQKFDLIMNGLGLLMVACGTVAIIDYLRAKGKIPLEMSKKIGKLEETMIRNIAGLGLMAAGVGAVIFGADTAVTRDLPSRDFWDGLNRVAISGSTTLAGAALITMGAAAMFIKDERSGNLSHS